MQERSLHRRDLLILCALVAFAAFLRFRCIGSESLWLDEGASVGIARLPLGDFFKLLWRREMNMALYYLLLKPWMWLGSSEAWIRSLSLLFSVATIPFLYLIGREVRSRAAGVYAAFLFALSPFAFTYAREARSYSLVCLLLAVATWCLLTKRWTAWAITITLAIYAHFFAGLVLAAHLLYLLISGQSLREQKGRLAKIALALLPILAFIPLKSRGQLNWIPRLSAATLKETFGEFAGGGDLALTMAVLVILAAMLTWRGPIRGDRTLILWLWLAFPILTLLLVSIWHPLLIARFLMISLPALLLLAAIALEGVPKPVAALLLIAMAFFSLRSDVLAWRTQTKDDWRSATAYVLQSSTPNDGVLFHQALGRQVFEFYESRDKATNAPQVISPAHGSRVTYRDFEDDNEDKVTAKLENPPQRLWLILSRNEANGTPDKYTRLLQELTRRHRPNCHTHFFRGVTAIECSE